MTLLRLHPDRALPIHLEQRRVAKEIYGETGDLPLIGMRGHLEAKVESDSRRIWRTFCEIWQLFCGAPSRYWLEHELVEVFGVDAIYVQIAASVAESEFRPCALLDRFNIEVISMTDPADSRGREPTAPRSGRYWERPTISAVGAAAGEKGR